MAYSSDAAMTVTPLVYALDAYGRRQKGRVFTAVSATGLDFLTDDTLKVDTAGIGMFGADAIHNDPIEYMLVINTGDESANVQWVANGETSAQDTTAGPGCVLLLPNVRGDTLVTIKAWANTTTVRVLAVS